MNPKTTLCLAAALVVVVGGLYLTRSDEASSTAPPPPPTELLADKSLIDVNFGEVVKVVCRRSDGAEWTFERPEDRTDDAGRSRWDLTAPFTARASGWQVDGIVRKLEQLRYKIKYAAGAGAVTAADAGLDPPRVVVTLQGDEEAGVTVEVGRDVSDRESYVRLAGAEDIYVVSPSLVGLLKEKAVAYRDLKLADFKAEHVKKLVVTDRPADGDPVVYTLVRTTDGWMIETPEKGRALAAKIDGLARSLSVLRATEWVEEEVADLGMFGLGNAGVTIEATIEEPADPAESDAEADADAANGDDSSEPSDATADDAEAPVEGPPPAPLIRQFVVHISRQAPLGEPTKVYLSKGDERTVGTLVKTTADGLMPNLAEWRDLRLTTAPVKTADRVELTTPQGQAVFERRQGKWVDAQSDQPVAGDEIEALLTEIDGLEARTFVRLADASAGAFGLDEPEAVIRLNVPGQPEAERFTVGGFTDAQTRRLRYVRYKDSDSVAKVRVADLAKTIRPPAEYRDRTIFDFKPRQVERVGITRPDLLGGEAFAFALARVDGAVRLVEPISVPAAEEPAKELFKALAQLQAERVLPDADPTGYGLDAPAITCTLTYQPPTITKYVEVPVEPDEPAETEDSEPDDAEQAADDTDEADETDDVDEAADSPEVEKKPATKLVAQEDTPPAEVYELAVSQHGDQVYAKRGDGPTIYQVSRALLEKLEAEYHQPDLFDFSESLAVGVNAPDATGQLIELNKVDDRWQLAAEPDLPLDPKKITNLLLQIRDLKADRYVAYRASDLAAFGLDAPWRSVTVTLEAGQQVGLMVSEQRCAQDAERRRFAVLLGGADVFLLADDALDRITVDPAEFEAP